MRSPFFKENRIKMNPNLATAFQNLESLSKIRQREVFCHIAKVTAINTPLVASDDLMLKTTMTSIGNYDRELSKIIFKHTSFPDIEEGGQKISFEQFIDNISYLDRQVLLWGIFDATYGSLGKRDIKCPHCEYEFEDDITSAELLQNDSLHPWEHESSFKDYAFKVVLPIEGIDTINRIEFITQLPSIQRHLAMLKLLPQSTIQINYEQFGALFSKVEELATVCSAVKVYKTTEDETPDVFETIKDIYFVVNEYILLDMVSSVLKDFNDHFRKYIPSFKKPYTCGECGKDFDFFVDMEISLFRRFLESD